MELADEFAVVGGNAGNYFHGSLFASGGGGFWRVLYGGQGSFVFLLELLQGFELLRSGGLVNEDGNAPFFCTRCF